MLGISGTHSDIRNIWYSNWYYEYLISTLMLGISGPYSDIKNIWYSHFPVSFWCL